MAQFLRLHAREDDFAQTVARARQFQEAHELAKPTKKLSIRLAQAPDRNATPEDKQANQLQPVLDGLQQVLQTVLQGQGEKVDTSARRHKTPCVRAASGSDCRGGKSTERQQPSPAPSGTSAPCSSGNREKAVRFQDQPSARCQQSTGTRQPASSGQDRGCPPAQRSWNNNNTQSNPRDPGSRGTASGIIRDHRLAEHQRVHASSRSSSTRAGVVIRISRHYSRPVLTAAAGMEAWATVHRHNDSRRSEHQHHHHRHRHGLVATFVEGKGATRTFMWMATNIHFRQ